MNHLNCLQLTFMSQYNKPRTVSNFSTISNFSTGNNCYHVDFPKKYFREISRVCIYINFTLSNDALFKDNLLDVRKVAQKPGRQREGIACL